jgi:uncharacterized protein YbjQ (UPF0145 family)
MYGRFGNSACAGESGAVGKRKGQHRHVRPVRDRRASAEPARTRRSSGCARDVIITTTSIVDGYRIVRYFPPVAVNLVVCAGIFSDILAGLTDVFGGRSATYQAHFAEMYADALRELEAKAEAAGANCLIGASFDLDQLSGKGMQMLMLNAVATPVTLKTPEQADADAAAEAAAAEAARAAEEQAEAQRRERLAKVTSLEGLLADPEIASRAREMRRMYGRGAYVSFVKRTAEELGLGEIELEPEDLPEKF